MYLVNKNLHEFRVIVLHCIIETCKKQTNYIITEAAKCMKTKLCATAKTHHNCRTTKQQQGQQSLGLNQLSIYNLKREKSMSSVLGKF